MRFLGNLVVIVSSTIAAMILFEFVLRVNNQFVSPNYDIEMWRYSKEMKVQVSNNDIAHVHVKNGQADLQRVSIETNEIGARGSKLLPFTDFENNILFIGSSVVLGWGVENSDTMSSRLQSLANNDGLKWQVANAGIGNYNTKRTISNYISNLSELGWDTVVYGYFVNDAEKLIPKDGNFLTRNFMIGVLVWKFLANLNSGDQSLVDYYRSIYEDQSVGFVEMNQSMVQFANHCKERNIRCVVAMIPDIHQTQPYELQFIHEKIRKLTVSNGIEFLDLYPELMDYKPEKLWNKYNDPHPNSFAHTQMGDAIYQYLLTEQ